MPEQNAESNVPMVLARQDGKVLWLTLNHPQRRNALSASMIDALSAQLTAAAGDESVHVVVISGAGSVFSAGHDLREMAQNQRPLLEKCASMMLQIRAMPQAVIACVQGTATAAGCQLVAACDLAIASEAAQFCLPGVNIGTFCTTPLVAVGRKIAAKHAMEMALTGEMFSAQDAWRFGLVNRLAAPESLQDECAQWATAIASRSRHAVDLGKAAFYRQIEMDTEAAYTTATDDMVAVCSSEDALEGNRAFFEKRDPEWKNR